MPARKKPISTKQKKAELQLKRAQKRGDVEKPPPNPASRRRGRGRGGHAMQVTHSNVVDASRRLESSFVKFSPAFLEEAKRKASTIIAERPIKLDKLIFPVGEHGAGSSLAVMKRPKWKYDMSKKEVEANEAGMFKKWLEETDAAVQNWAQAQNDGYANRLPEEGMVNSEASADAQDVYKERMPTAPPMFERNLEVWRQLYVGPLPRPNEG